MDQWPAAPMQQGSGGKPHRSKDPLLHGAHNKVWAQKHQKENAGTPPAQRVFQLTVLAFVPFVVYVTFLFVTTFRWFYSYFHVLMAVGITVGLSIMQYLIVEHATRNRAKKWKKWIGYFTGIAAIAGLLVGLAIHFHWMLYYHKYSNMMKYSNVAASQPALEFEDAGSLLFTQGTTVDRTRAVGYRHIRSSQTLCVAPVVDSQMGPSDNIVFFAVGVNCCGWRASFHCDDASNGGTRGGLLVLEPNRLVSPAMEWAVDGHFDFEAFEDAIALQKSVFAVSAAKHHRMLRWVKEPLKEIDHYRKRGLEAGIISCVAFLVVAGVLAFQDVVAEGVRQKRLAAQLLGRGVDAEA